MSATLPRKKGAIVKGYLIRFMCKPDSSYHLRRITITQIDLGSVALIKPLRVRCSSRVQTRPQIVGKNGSRSDGVVLGTLLLMLQQSKRA